MKYFSLRNLKLGLSPGSTLSKQLFREAKAQDQGPRSHAVRINAVRWQHFQQIAYVTYRTIIATESLALLFEYPINILISIPCVEFLFSNTFPPNITNIIETTRRNNLFSNTNKVLCFISSKFV